MWPAVSGCWHKPSWLLSIWDSALKPCRSWGAQRYAEHRTEALSQETNSSYYFHHALDAIPSISPHHWINTAIPIRNDSPRSHRSFAQWLLREPMLWAPLIGWGECPHGATTSMSAVSQLCILGTGPASMVGWWRQGDREVLIAARWLVGMTCEAWGSPVFMSHHS